MRTTKSRWFLCTFFSITFLLVSSLPVLAGNISDHIVKSEEGYYYVVQKGDTLWDLSQHFSDSPWLWPDLWKENDQIKNPHLIYPGQKIRLLYRGWSDQAAEKKPEPLPPPPPEPVYFTYAGIDMVGFVRTEAVPPLGELIKVRDDKTMISEGDLVFFNRQDNDTFLQGGRYLIYRTFKPVKNKDTGFTYGIQHLFVGIAQINRIEPEFVQARITSSFQKIQIGDKLMPYRPRSTEIEVKPSVEGLTGVIFLEETGKEIFGQDNIVFIDKGSADGVEAGQYYAIYDYNRKKVRKEAKKPTDLTPIQDGRIFILHAEETTSTALITDSERHFEDQAGFSYFLE